MRVSFLVLVTILVCNALVFLCVVLYIAYMMRRVARAHTVLAERVMRLESHVFPRMIPDEKLVEAFGHSFPDILDDPSLWTSKSDI